MSIQNHMEGKVFDISIFNKHIDEVKQNYPFLKLSMIPYKDEMYFLEGYLLRNEQIDTFHIKSEEEAKGICLYVYVEITKYYRRIGVKVYDKYQMIPVNKIKEINYNYAHFNGMSEEKGTLICTHIPKEAEEFDNPILLNLNCAHYLFNEYNNLIENNVFRIKGYSHGKEGIKEYEQIRKQKSNRITKI